MKKKILIVEDDGTQRLGLSLLVKNHFGNGKENEILTAENGKKATEVILASVPNLIITDNKMPEMNGIDLIKWVRKFCPKVPVVMISDSFSTPANHGADVLLSKPVEEETLFISLDMLLSYRKS